MNNASDFISYPLVLFNIILLAVANREAGRLEVFLILNKIFTEFHHRYVHGRKIRRFSKSREIFRQYSVNYKYNPTAQSVSAEKPNATINTKFSVPVNQQSVKTPQHLLQVTNG